ncbi:MAG: glycosyltransferase family 4 protein [Persicimonas sp.]
MEPSERTHRVLMSTDTVGGVWTYTLELAGRLCERGMWVDLAAMGREPSPEQRRAAEAIGGLTFSARPYRLEWMKDPWEDVDAAGRWLVEMAERRPPDVVHLNTLVHGNLDWSAPVLTVGHSCVLSWFEAVKGQSAPADWSRYARRVTDSLQASDWVVAPTHAMLDELERHYGPFSRCEAIYNGRSAKGYEPRVGDEIVLSAGRLWDEAKNIEAVARAAERIDWPVYVAGAREHPDGGSSTPLGRARPLGQLPSDQLAEWYARAAIYALPARYEPFGLTALEAALSDNALVLGDIDTLREVWGESAVYVDPERPDQLATTIQALIEQPGRRHRLARRALRRAKSLSAESMVDGYVDLYERMVAQHATVAPSASPGRSAR